MNDRVITDTQLVMISLDVNQQLTTKLELINSSGIKSVEIICSDTQLLNELVVKYPQLNIGAGGIMSTTELENCYHAEVAFVTSPGFHAPILQTASIYSINYIPGVATISEAMSVYNLGLKNVRPCPADLTFCNLLNKYLPELSLYPVEIAKEDMEHYISLPSVAAVTVANPDEEQIKSLSASVVM